MEPHFSGLRSSTSLLFASQMVAAISSFTIMTRAAMCMSCLARSYVPNAIRHWLMKAVICSWCAVHYGSAFLPMADMPKLGICRAAYDGSLHQTLAAAFSNVCGIMLDHSASACCNCHLHRHGMQLPAGYAVHRRSYTCLANPCNGMSNSRAACRQHVQQQGSMHMITRAL